MNEFEKIIKDIHKTAIEKGFWEDYDKIMEILEQYPDLQKSAKQAFISQKLMLMVSELGEALEALRNDKFADTFRFKNSTNNEFWFNDFERFIKNTFEDELADFIIRVFDLARKMEIDIEWHIKMKMDYNNRRPYKHGRNF